MRPTLQGGKEIQKKMLTLLAYSMVIVFMALIMTKRLSAMVALILVPIAFAAIGGFGPELGPMMLDGVKKLAPTGVMLMFAILYFGLMIDAGLFDPVVRAILKIVAAIRSRSSWAPSCWPRWCRSTATARPLT